MSNFEEILQNCNEINNDNEDQVKILGDGSLGTVYKLENQKFPIAIKCMKNTNLTNELAGFEQDAYQKLGSNSTNVIKYHGIKEAIKELKFSQNEKNDNFIYLLREIGILAYCDHPNIAKIKAVYFHPNKIKDKYHVSIIEPRYYKDLDSILFIEKSIINKKIICYQILKALQYIHETGLVHLDLKPSNLMFTDESLTEIVIIDFGISDIYRENQRTKLLGMTIAYSPPEMRFNDLSNVSPKADIFSFGIILYELITERRAWAKYYKQNNQSQIYNVIRSPNFSFCSENIPTGIHEIDKLIEKCTSIDVAQRPSAREILEIIKSFRFKF